MYARLKSSSVIHDWHHNGDMLVSDCGMKRSEDQLKMCELENGRLCSRCIDQEWEDADEHLVEDADEHLVEDADEHLVEDEKLKRPYPWLTKK